ncbi:MAG: class II fructose-bisphosphate aldolase [Anaerolineae bacterium]|nr:class II fructose-bisphosphate aldolase [Anaerolineae bacterium]MDW8070990.1 class II fructose-bisphosphate aldolase [Anaerolineae bacterium]
MPASPTTDQIIRTARQKGLVVPAFNIPYLPMMEPVVRAIVDQDCFALIETARLEWIKFEARSAEAVMKEYQKWAQPDYMRIHLDHVPVIDEDWQRVDYLEIIREALDLGYESVMVDGSRLPLEENIQATRQVVEMAHRRGVPVEAELGAVMGHEAGPLPPYEELFASGKGFTDVEEARRFARESGCDWLSVAAGNIHGAVSGIARDQPKVEARLNLEHLEKLYQATGLPLVLHGGSGIKRDNVLAAIQKGIAKVNIGTEIRQAYEQAWRATGSIAKAQEACYERTCWLIRDYFGIAGDRAQLLG